jgi:RNA polymerase sigma-70 factor (ECF subfamily)
VIEKELIERAKEGDPAAFTSLVENYQTAVFNLCYRILGEADEAEDAAQETFLRVYRNLHRHDSSRSFTTWLFSIASHYCIDLLRKRKMVWLELEDESEHPALHEPVPDPEEMAIRREASATMQKHLSRLAPEDRAVLILRYWYDLSHEEIAEARKTTTKAVKSRLHRAKLTLAEKISPAGLSQLKRGVSLTPAGSEMFIS